MTLGSPQHATFGHRTEPLPVPLPSRRARAEATVTVCSALTPPLFSDRPLPLRVSCRHVAPTQPPLGLACSSPMAPAPGPPSPCICPRRCGPHRTPFPRPSLCPNPKRRPGTSFRRPTPRRPALHLRLPCPPTVTVLPSPQASPLGPLRPLRFRTAVGPPCTPRMYTRWPQYHPRPPRPPTPPHRTHRP